MSLLSFLKDKAALVTIAIFTAVGGSIILYALGCPLSLTISVSGLYVLGLGLALLYEYANKRTYYKELLNILEELQQKRLISEIMEAPTFQEGLIWRDILKAANKSMNDEVARLEKANREYQEYVELWVHEIKTPISGARLICENNGYNGIEEEVDKIEKYVEQALFYAKIGSVELDYAIQKMDVKDLVGNVVKRNAKHLIARKIKIEHHARGLIYTDPKWMEFILQQILDNAVKYGAKTIEYSFENYTLTMKDDGVGIPQKDLPRVFERGFTGENGRKTAQSTGMGLYLCKRLCDKLGIGIGLQSEQGIAPSESGSDTGEFSEMRSERGTVPPARESDTDEFTLPRSERGTAPSESVSSTGEFSEMRPERGTAPPARVSDTDEFTGTHPVQGTAPQTPEPDTNEFTELRPERGTAVSLVFPQNPYATFMHYSDHS